MVEVFTIGGGEYIVNTFNAVAAWTGGGGYRALLRVVMVLGLIYSLLSVAFTMNFRVWMNWFLGSSLIYMCLMVPTVTVKVTDRINPSLGPAVVANVPLGLGVIASFTSQVGDWLTRTAETVFTMPTQLSYSTNGMVYGARLLDATRNFQIRDAEFSTNLSAHFKNCTFGDIMLGQKSMTELATAKDLWAAMGPGSVARSQPWVERSGAVTTTSIVPCRQAYTMLNGLWHTMIEAHTSLWAKETYPKLSTAVASAKLRSDVPIVNQAFTASSAGYEATVRQNTAINAFMMARDGMAGGPGAASIDTFATTRADIQARNTYNSIAQQAMSWVPILNIVLTVVFYAMFPVIFPLFLMPQTGVGALKGYLTGFFYLAAWGPLYVILHMICMTRATAAAQGVSEGGMSLGTYAGIGAVNAETATIAGFMLMSVPFLAAGLAKGAMSISGQATSVLAPAQNAAEAAAAEQTTGNYSYGNTSFANSTSNMRQSNQWQSAPTSFSGASSYSVRTDNGAVLSFGGNGEQVTNASGAISQLPYKITATENEVAATSQNAAEATRIAHSNTNGSSNDVSFTLGAGSSIVSSLANATGFDARAGVVAGSDIQRFGAGGHQARTGLNSVLDGGSRLSNGDRYDDQFSFQKSLGLDANAGMKWGGGGKGSGGLLSSVIGGLTGGGKPEAGVGLSGGVKGIWSDSWNTYRNKDLNTGRNDAESLGTSTDLNDGFRYAVNDGTTSSSGQIASSILTNSRSNTTSQQLDRNWRVTAARQELQEIANSANREVSYSNSNSMGMSTDLSQKLQSWYIRERMNNPQLNLPELHDQTTNTTQDQARDLAFRRFMSQRNEAVTNRIAELKEVIETNGLSNVDLEPVAQASSITGRFSGHGGVGNPHAVTLSAPDRKPIEEKIDGLTGVVRDQRDTQKPIVRTMTGRELKTPE